MPVAWPMQYWPAAAEGVVVEPGAGLVAADVVDVPPVVVVADVPAAAVVEGQHDWQSVEHRTVRSCFPPD